jgi:hypothetical protein
VNFTALPIRLSSTWRTRSGSIITRSGNSPSAWHSSHSPLVSAWGANRARASWATAAARRPRRDLDLAGLELGEVEHVVDDRQQRLAGARHPLHVPARQLVQLRPLGQQAGKPDDGRQGRADLVAHIGHELALHDRGRLGLGAGGGQGLLLADLLGHVADHVQEARRRVGGRIAQQRRIGFQPHVALPDLCGTRQRTRSGDLPLVRLR